MNRRFAPPLAMAAAVAVLGAGPPAPPTLETLLAHATAYVEAYERELGSVIADEQYMQEVSFPGALPNRSSSDAGRQPESRSLVSEFFFIRPSPERDLWLGFRHVLTVNGFPVQDSTVRLRDLLAGGRELTDAAFRELIDESARYNLGKVARNVNVPTFPLLILHPSVRRGFRFKKTGARRVDGVDAWAVGFDERARPTLIRDAEGRNVEATGTFWIDPASGRVVQTELVTDEPAEHLHAQITVKYRAEPALALWVPTEMTEKYHAGVEYHDERNILCVAKYSNFRRFEVKVRLGPPASAPRSP